jgi:hypothetical protein
MPCIEITYEWTIDGACVAEVEARVTYDYSPGSNPYYDRTYGNWMPGDPPEIEIENVELIELGAKKPRLAPCPDFLADLIADYALTNCSRQMVENGDEDAYDRQCEAADARRDWLRDEGRAF